MATIRLNSITKPREIKSNKTQVNLENFPNKPTYTDLHLDLQIQKNVGLGNQPRNSGDIKVDTDIEAIKNSMRNIFNTRRGQKILSPDFGTSLEQFLFESVNEFTAKIIGETIVSDIRKFEPRVEVKKVQVFPFPDLNQYNIVLKYTFRQLKDIKTVQLTVLNDGQIII